MDNFDVEQISLPPPSPSWQGCVRLVCLSDTHTIHSNLDVPDGDILLHSGDFTNKGSREEVRKFDAWLGKLPHKHKVVVPGNHDSFLDLNTRKQNEEEEDLCGVDMLENAHVLVNTSIHVEGLTIAGSPFTVSSTTNGFKQRLKGYVYAFGSATEEDMAENISDIPVQGVDIVVTHSPPLGIGDGGKGSLAIRKKVFEINPILHIFGHIHEQGGGIFRIKRQNQDQTGARTTFVNAALLKIRGINSCLKMFPVNFSRTPIVLDIDKQTKQIVI